MHYGLEMAHIETKVFPIKINASICLVKVILPDNDNPSSFLWDLDENEANILCFQILEWLPEHY